MLKILGLGQGLYGKWVQHTGQDFNLHINKYSLNYHIILRIVHGLKGM